MKYQSNLEMSIVMDTMFKVLFSIVIASNLVGNLLVILVVLLNRRMQTPMNCLLANLALADFFVGLFLTPRTLFNDLYTHPGGWLGDFLCKMLTHACFTYLAAVASMLTLMFIAWERYYAVMYPHSSRGRINASKLRLLIAVSWLVAFGYASLEFWIIKFDEQRKACIYDWSETLWKTDVFVWCIGLSFSGTSWNRGGPVCTSRLPLVGQKDPNDRNLPAFTNDTKEKTNKNCSSHFHHKYNLTASNRCSLLSFHFRW